MSNKSLVAVFGVVGLLCFGICAALPPAQPSNTVGAATGMTIPWSSLLQFLFAAGGGSSILTSILAALGKLGGVVEKIVHVPVPTPVVVDPPSPAPVVINPTIPADFGKDAIEILLAVWAYSQKPEDISVQDRLVNAALAAIRDVLSKRSPEIAEPLNALAIAIANSLFKAKPVKTVIEAQ